jgi:hypothetical protein
MSYDTMTLRAHERAQDEAEAAHRQCGPQALEIWKANLADDEGRLDDFVIETCIEPIKILIRDMLFGGDENTLQADLMAIKRKVREEAVRFADDDPDYDVCVWELYERAA